jgi:hypothetical protein
MNNEIRVTSAGELLTRVLKDTGMAEEAREYAEIINYWHDAVINAFIGAKYPEKRALLDSGRMKDEEYDELKLQFINAEKTAEHTRVADIRGRTLVVEADHAGWIQVLLTKKKNILNLFKKQFPKIKIENIITRTKDKRAEKAGRCQNDTRDVSTFNTMDAGGQTVSYSEVKDTELRNILINLEKSISKKVTL